LREGSRLRPGPVEATVDTVAVNFDGCHEIGTPLYQQYSVYTIDSKTP